MKKKLRIILWVLFGISSIFIGTGAILIDNSFYYKNNTQDSVVIICEAEDGSIEEYKIAEGDSLLIYSKKVFRLNNNIHDFEFLVKKLTVYSTTDTIVHLKPKWFVYTRKRKNTFVLNDKR